MRCGEAAIDAFVVELQRADKLGIPYVVTHPGAYTTSSEAAGLARIVAALDEVHARRGASRPAACWRPRPDKGAPSAGGSSIWPTIIDGVQGSRAAGRVRRHLPRLRRRLSARPRKPNIAATMQRVRPIVGLDRIKAFHLNDSKKELGSRVDRHEHIGRGRTGPGAVPPAAERSRVSRGADVPGNAQRARKTAKSWT